MKTISGTTNPLLRRRDSEYVAEKEHWAVKVRQLDVFCHSILTLSSCVGFLWIAVLLVYPLIDSVFSKRLVCVALPSFARMFMVGQIRKLRMYNEPVSIGSVAFCQICCSLRLCREIDWRIASGTQFPLVETCRTGETSL